MKPSPILVAVLLVAVSSACPGSKANKGKTAVDGRKDGLNSPAVTLIVGGVDPSFANPRTELSVEVFGGGFVPGATVGFSGAPARETRFNDSSSLVVSVPALEPGTYEVTVTNPDGVKATLRKGLTIRDVATTSCQGATLLFDLDSANLSPAARAALEVVAGCVRTSAQAVVVEGHCDERGTTEYNLALGQRRADSVSRYLAGLGVNPARLRPVSFGAERPAVEGHNADAWSANRRAVLVVEP